MILLEHLFKMPHIITFFFAFLCMFLTYRSWQYLTFDPRLVVLLASLVLTRQQMRYASLYWNNFKAESRKQIPSERLINCL